MATRCQARWISCRPGYFLPERVLSCMFRGVFLGKLVRREPTARQDAVGMGMNTLSVDNTDVQVFYPFHPLHGVTLRILRRPKRGDGAVCVMDPAGRRLKIPVWMLLPECAEITISQQPHLGQQALLSLVSLIASQLDSKNPAHDNLRPPRVRGSAGGRRGATSTFRSDDLKGMRRRANGRSDTRRSGRSHSARDSSGVSREKRE
jgi:hypothetical protein